MRSISPSRRIIVLCVSCAAVALAGSAPAFAQEDPTPKPGPLPDARPQVRPQDRPQRPLTATEELRREVDSLLEELKRLREELAAARLEADEAKRELAEMRQFIADHREYGTAFDQYRGVREVAEREAKRREAEAARERREAERLQQLAKQREARSTRDARRAELAEERRLREAGFAPIGLDVYVGQTSYYYGPAEARVPYDPWLGFYHPFDTDTRRQIEFSSMTISGSVLSASPVVRNIGVAVTFFDRRGNQVGNEIIEINNARPNVPYPFTSVVKMALDRPFSTSSTYVLYADPVEE